MNDLQSSHQVPYTSYDSQYSKLQNGSSNNIDSNFPGSPGQDPSGYSQHLQRPETDYDLLRKAGQSQNPSADSSASTLYASTNGKKSRINSAPGHLLQQQQQPLHFGRFLPMPGFNPSNIGMNGNVGANGMPGQGQGSANAADLSQMYAAMDALGVSGGGSMHPSQQNFLNGPVGSLGAPMMQQGSHASSSSGGLTSSSGSGGGIGQNNQLAHAYNANLADQRQRTMSAMPGLPGNSPTAPLFGSGHTHAHPGYGLVGPVSNNINNGNSAAASPPSNQTSLFPTINNPPLNAAHNPQQQQALLAATSALMAATGGDPNFQRGHQQQQQFQHGAGSMPMAQNMSASTSGGVGNPALMQSHQALSPNMSAFAAFGQGPGGQAFNPALAAAAGLGMPGLFGLGSFGLPGVGGVGGLGMSLPMTSPHLSQPVSDNGNQTVGPQVVRTVYVGNLPGDASVDELLSLVRYGPIESVKILPDKSCAFISFLDPSVAAAFHSDANLRKLQLHGQELKIGWGKPTGIPAIVLQAVQQHGATRNVYLGNLDETYTEQTLRDELSRFGHLDQVKIVRDKNIGFVHFLSIANAIKVVQELPKDPTWQGRRVNYGKDRCAYVPRNQHQQQQHNQMAAVMAAQAASQVTGFPSPFNPMSPAMMSLSPMMSPMNFQGGFVDPSLMHGNRTVYLGNLHPDTTCEDVCNTVRGGILQEVRHIPDKHICFITFVMPESALALHQYASQQGITIKNRRLKVGWGKSSGPCPPGISAIVNAGGSRNVYIGNIDDFETFTLDKIKDDLGEFGEIEQVNALQEKSCAFVNFTKISSAVKAIEALKSHPEYSRFKIAYGKDRVGNLARTPFMRRGGGNGLSHSHHGTPHQGEMSSPLPNSYHSPSIQPHESASGADQEDPEQLRHSALSPQLNAAVNAAAAVDSVEQQQQQKTQQEPSE